MNSDKKEALKSAFLLSKKVSNDLYNIENKVGHFKANQQTNQIMSNLANAQLCLNFIREDINHFKKIKRTK